MDDRPHSVNLPPEAASESSSESAPSGPETAPSGEEVQVTDKPGEAAQPSAASPVRQGKKPRSAAQQAADMANLKKAWAAPKEKIYRRTPKREASRLANLAIAHAVNRQPLEQAVAQLDRAFPLLRKDGQPASSIEEVEESTVEESNSAGPLDSSTSSTQDPKSETIGDAHQAGEAHEAPIQDSKSKIQSRVEPATVEDSDSVDSLDSSTCNSSPTPPIKQVEPSTVSPTSSIQNPESTIQNGDGAGPLDSPTFDPSTAAIDHSLSEEAIDLLDLASAPAKAAPAAVNRQARGYKALEKAARAILHRPRAIGNRARREAQHVMRLLIPAALRGAIATREDILTLSARLLGVLTHSCVLARAVLLNAVIKRRLKAFMKERYGAKVDVTHLWPEFRLRSARRKAAESPQEAGTEAGGASSDQPLPPRRHRTRRPPPKVPDLPEKLEQFQALVRLAFGLPHPGPEDATQAGMLDHMAANLWDRLHLFEGFVWEEKERYDPGVHYAGVDPPRHGWEIVQRCRYVADLLEEDPKVEGMVRGYLKTIHHNVGDVLRERYGPSPDLDRFFGTR